MSPSRSRRALIGSALAAALLGSPPGAALAQEVGKTVEEGKPSAEPSAPKAKKPKKTRKQEQEERLKYQISPEVGKAFSKARGQLEAQQYAEATATLDELHLDDLTPYERAYGHRLYGYIRYGKEENDPAIEQLRQALAEKDALPQRERADVLFQIAQIQGVDQRWKDLIATLEEWLQVVEQPNSIGYYLMALAYFQLEDLDAALPPAQKAVEIAKVPQQSWLQLLLAIHLTKQDYAAAKPVMEQMIALYPNLGKDFWLQLSSIYAVTGDEPSALGVLEIAYRRGILTDDRDLRRLLQFMLARGIPYRATQIFEKEMAEKRFQDDAEALELLSIGWILAREPAKAMQPLSRAAELSATGNLYVHLAQIHLLEERWEEAISVLRKALAKGGLKEPGTVELMLGIAYYNEQQLQEARSWFAQAQRSGATRQQAEIWLQHVDRELAATGSNLGKGG